MKTVQINEKKLDNNFLEIDYPEGRSPLSIKDFIYKEVLDSDYERLINQNLILKEKGKPVLVYMVVDDIYNEKELVRELNKIRFEISRRQKGLIGNSRVFGYSPRIAIKRDFCSTSLMASEHQLAHEMVCDLGKHISDYYKKYCPDMFDFHDDKSKIIKDEWKIQGTPFSSGIINKNNALKYHLDTGNIRDVYSNMLCFRKNITGGHLVLPEFNLALEIANRSVVFFDGQDIIHGVSHFNMKTLNAYRFTIVYYTLHQMWRCQTITEELIRTRDLKKQKEERRLRMMKGEEEVSPEMARKAEQFKSKK